VCQGDEASSTIVNLIQGQVTTVEDSAQTTTESKTTEAELPKTTAEDTLDQCGINKVCVKLTAIEPQIAKNRAGSTIFLLGSGLTENAKSLVLSVNGKLIGKNEYTVVNLKGQYFVKWVLTETSTYEGSVMVEVALGKNDQSEQSEARQLQFFDPSVSQIFPASFNYPFAETSIQIAGLPMFPTGTPLCVFYLQSDDEGQIISFVSPQIDSGVYVCALSPISVQGKSAKIFVDILLDTPKFATPDHPDVEDYLRIDNFASVSPKFIALIAPAPILTGAKFSDNGASVVVSFDRAIQIINAKTYIESDYLTLSPVVGSVSCADVLNSDFTVYGKFEGTAGECLISQNEYGSFDINISGEFANTDILALAVDDWVGLLNNTIASSGEEFSMTAAGEIQVLPPTIIPSPLLQVLYSPVITECSDTVIWDFSLSSTGKFVSFTSNNHR
jgi:hypothetical protein